jgi:TPR repeat protein
MCLLSSGYRWKDSTKTYFEEVQDLAQAGAAPAQSELGQLYFSFRNPERRLDHNQFANWTRKAAEQGYPIAQYNLGWAYAQGDGLERNDAEALRWMLRAAESGYARAKPILQRSKQMEAELRARREDVRDLDQDKAAAEGGDAKAQFKLASRYEDGRGVDHDMKLAMEWYRKSAEGGNRTAQGYLGVIYDKGRGVKQDEAEAARWYRKAAEQGYGQSQFNLGVFYLHGHGVEKNKEEAKKWLERARDNGYKAAEQALKEEF